MDAFKAQAEGLAEGGVDVLWLETMYAMEELEAAMEAVKRHWASSLRNNEF